VLFVDQQNPLMSISMHSGLPSKRSNHGAECHCNSDASGELIQLLLLLPDFQALNDGVVTISLAARPIGCTD